VLGCVDFLDLQQEVHSDNYIGSAIATADYVSKDINDDDDQTVGCTIACAAHADIPSNSIPRILVTKMMTVVLWKHVTSLD
jgi:hypothetical protein